MPDTFAALYLSSDGVRAAFVLLLAIGQAAMAFWPDIAKWPQTITTRSAKLDNPVVPVSWAFAIWGPIFFGSMVFAVWHALPGNLMDPVARQIGWLAAALFAGNIAWELYVPKRAIDRISVVIILVELALALTLVFKLADLQAGFDWTRTLAVAVPLQVFAGWVTVAAFVNMASAMRHHGINVSVGVAAALIGAAGMLTVVVVSITQAWPFAVSACWGLMGVMIANLNRERHPGLAALAAALIAVVAIVTLTTRLG